MLLWLKAHDGSAVNAEAIEALTFDDIPTGQNDAEGNPMSQTCVVAMLRGCKIVLQPVPNQQEGIKFIGALMVYIKKEYDRQHKIPQIEEATVEDAEVIGKAAKKTNKVILG
jgi:hypothetical protein